MDKMFDELNISIKDLEDVANIDDIQAKSIFNSMSVENKQYALSLFVGMAEVDGYYDPTEKAIINSLVQ